MSKEGLYKSLAKVLANSYTLYLKTQNFHWNVRGPQFHSLHSLFEIQYTDLAAAIDEIAERIRSIGFPAPGSFKEFLELSAIRESDGKLSATEMVKEIFQDQQIITESLQKALKKGQDLHDEATVDLMIQRIQVHEKNAWMLESSLPQ
ncbi:MAG: DNA starvation/stationary phase protection protein [Bdellovibrionales bacterium]|nr:DNA starvation/stationary phase protection protein [Bdellovibrionales bacterium]